MVRLTSVEGLHASSGKPLLGLAPGPSGNKANPSFNIALDPGSSFVRYRSKLVRGAVIRQKDSIISRHFKYGIRHDNKKRPFHVVEGPLGLYVVMSHPLGNK